MTIQVTYYSNGKIEASIMPDAPHRPFWQIEDDLPELPSLNDCLFEANKYGVTYLLEKLQKISDKYIELICELPSWAVDCFAEDYGLKMQTLQKNFILEVSKANQKYSLPKQAELYLRAVNIVHKINLGKGNYKAYDLVNTYNKFSELIKRN